MVINAGQEQPRMSSQVPSDLTGKQIHHQWIVEGESEWFSGTVLERVAGQESDSGMWYNVKYDNEDNVVTLNLQEDIEAGDIMILWSFYYA